MVYRLKAIIAVCAALSSAGAVAETLPVSGVYPAGNDTVAALETIAVERFGGEDGQQLGLAVADRLRAVTIDGEPYFRVVPEGAEADAVLQGTAAGESRRREASSREERVCVERDEDRDCIRREKRDVPCWELVARLDAQVRLVSTGGELLYALDREDELPQRFCQGDERPSAERMVRTLAERYADQLRDDFGPVQRSEQIRVMEDRDGLSRDDGRAFRAAVQLTKTDREAACTAWAALEPGNPDHPSVLFNLGLCEESHGRLREARDYYQRVIVGGDEDSYARLGTVRIESRWRANAQLESRRRP